MTGDERKALAALRFNWAPVPDDVWRHSPYHVEGLHPVVEQSVLDGIEDTLTSADASPVGVVLQGQRGAGKTHLLGWVREQVQARGGYFFLVGLLDAGGFWHSVAGSLVEGLFRPGPDGDGSQLQTLLRRLGTAVGAPRTVRRAVAGETTLTREALDTFAQRLRGLDSLVARECQETARALALLAADAPELREVGETYLQSIDDEHGERHDWGMRRAPRPAELVVRDLSWLLALTGPVVIAVDQIDTLLTQSVQTLRGQELDQLSRDAVLEQIAGGLMSMRDRTRRTLTVVACLPNSWQLIKTRATDTVQDRFREAAHLKTIPTAEIGQALVEKRFAVRFTDVGFDPPYRSWPVAASAFADAPGFTPRQLLIEIDRHVQSCLLDGEARELTTLGEPPTDEPHAPPDTPETVTAADLARLDARFTELQANVDVAAALDPHTEDRHMPALLAAGLTAWIVEHGDTDHALSQDPPPSANPALHARLRRTLDESTEDQLHWGFRAIAATHPVAALSRLRKASTAAGLTEGVTKRKLFVLRNPQWSAGAKTTEALDAFHARGGETLEVKDADLRMLGALQALFEEDSPHLPAWLAAQQPAGQVEVFRRALGEAGEVGLPEEAVPAPSPVGRPAAAGPQIPIGTAFDDEREVRLDIEALRKHVALFAGSGSGKTVLIRRLVEECALQGVSAIVLDPNNDLARLGEAWPDPPDGWDGGDSAKAEDYLAHTEVVVWTPRREAGRPLSFQPLPDFGSVRGDVDEFDEAVEVAVASIAPRVKLDGRTDKAQRGLAVLRNAVQHFGRHGGTGLKGLVDLLSDLPEDVSELDGADRIAAGLAQSLTAAMVNDPLFGGAGTPVDPGLLLTPEPGMRARISVISFVGLPSDEQRQSFVNQLQMALFAWIKRHPAGDRPLGGLLVMDEAQTLAPSGALTACTQSTLALASQARKYGLGLVFATQSPKGLHNRIPGNATTQFFGLLNAPAQVSAAKEMATAKGGQVPDISRLRTGEFYAALEGDAFTKVRTPLCLSHHPPSPLTTEEVVQRASR